MYYDRYADVKEVERLLDIRGLCHRAIENGMDVDFQFRYELVGATFGKNGTLMPMITLRINGKKVC